MQGGTHWSETKETLGREGGREGKAPWNETEGEDTWG
jgi:hypothetical protein